MDSALFSDCCIRCRKRGSGVGGSVLCVVARYDRRRQCAGAVRSARHEAVTGRALTIPAISRLPLCLSVCHPSSQPCQQDNRTTISLSLLSGRIHFSLNYLIIVFYRHRVYAADKGEEKWTHRTSIIYQVMFKTRISGRYRKLTVRHSHHLRSVYLPPHTKHYKKIRVSASSTPALGNKLVLI